MPMTKKKVVTQMAESLVSKCEVSDLPKYAGEWEPLYDDLRRQFESAYKVFELEFDHEIAPLVEDLRRAREHVQSAEANFKSGCERSRQTLESKIEKAAMDRRRDSVDRESESKRLMADQPDLRQRFKKERVALTGGEDVSVPEWPGLTSKLLFWTTLTVFIGIEYLVGFELFDWISNPNTALGLSAMVVVGFTAGTYFAVHRFRRISGHRDALHRFRQTFPNGHPDGLSVDRLPSAETHVAYILGTLLATFAFAVLIGRSWIAVQSDQGFGGVAAAAGLLFCFVGYGAFEYYLAHPNSRQQVADLRAAEKEFEENETRLQRALDSGPSEQRYREATDQAIAEYNDAVESEYQRWSDTAAIDTKRQELLGALYGYQLAWEAFQRGLSDRCRQLVERVSLLFSLKSGDIVLPDDDIIETFSNNVHRHYANSELFEECKQKFSTISLERPVLDMQRLKGEIEVSVSMTPETLPSPEPLETPAFASVRTKGASG